MWMIQSTTPVKDLITDCYMPAIKVVVYYKYYNIGTGKCIYSGKWQTLVPFKAGQLIQVANLWKAHDSNANVLSKLVEKGRLGGIR